MRAPLVVSLTLLIALHAHAQTSVDFRQAAAYAASERTTALALGDFDQDGNLDVAAASSAVSTVNIFLGDGSGELERSADALTGGIPVGIAAGRFDADAFPDLILSEEESDNLWFLRNRGDGTFLTARQVIGGHDPWAVLAVDVDRDGNLDAVQSLTAETGGRVNVLYGDGAGGFSAPLGARTDAPSRAVAIADVNGDGISDAVATNASGSVSVLRGRGDRTFAPQVESPVGAQPAGLAAADLDGDDRVDVVSSSFGEDSLVFSRGLGGTALAAPRFHAVGDGPIGVALADLNGDQHLDVAVANSRSASVSVLLNDETGELSAARSYIAAPTPIAVVAGDLNHDGLPDLISGSHGTTDGVINVMLANGVGVDAIEQLSADAAGGAVAVGDLDGDQLPDAMVALPTAESVALFFSGGAGAPFRSSSIDLGGAPTALTLGDFDRNGLPDLVVATAADTNLSFFFNHAGALAPAVALAVEQVPGAIAAADYDGSGTLDLACAPAAVAEISLRRGDGSGGFGAPATRTLAAPAVALVAADFNGDGRADLAALTSMPTIELLLGSSTGLLNPIRATIGSAAVAIAALDADGDDNLDLALALVSGTIRVLLGNGGGGFVDGARVPGVEALSAIAARDVTGDRRADLIVTRPASASVAVIANDGLGGWLAPALLRVDAAPAAAIAGDFDGDGGYDIFASAGQPAIALNRRHWSSRGDGNGDGTLSAADLVGIVTNLSGAVPLAVELASADGADADGDGSVSRQDILAATARLYQATAVPQGGI